MSSQVKEHRRYVIGINQWKKSGFCYLQSTRSIMVIDIRNLY